MKILMFPAVGTTQREIWISIVFTYWGQEMWTICHSDISVGDDWGACSITQTERTYSRTHSHWKEMEELWTDDKEVLLHSQSFLSRAHTGPHVCMHAWTHVRMHTHTQERLMRAARNRWLMKVLFRNASEHHAIDLCLQPPSPYTLTRDSVKTHTHTQHLSSLSS